MKIPENIKAVIFDVDGLLIDSISTWEKADQAIIAKYSAKNLKFYDPEEVRGMGSRDALLLFKERFDIEVEIEALLREFRDGFYKIAFENNSFALMEGAKEILVSLSTVFPLAVATGGHTKEKITEILEKLQILNFFKVIISSDDVAKGKPDPDVFLETAKQLGAIPETCLVFEDAVNGVLAGKAAKMTVYGVNSDPDAREKLKEAGADEVFESLTEVEV